MSESVPGWRIATESQNLVPLPPFLSAVALQSAFPGPRRISWDRCRKDVPLLGAAGARELTTTFRGCWGPWLPSRAQEPKLSEASRISKLAHLLLARLPQIFRLSYRINLTNWQRRGWWGRGPMGGVERGKWGEKLLRSFKPSHSECSLAHSCKNHIFSPGSANCMLGSGLSLTLGVLVETSLLYFPGLRVFAGLLLLQTGPRIYLLSLLKFLP